MLLQRASGHWGGRSRARQKQGQVGCHGRSFHSQVEQGDDPPEPGQPEEPGFAYTRSSVVATSDYGAAQDQERLLQHQPADLLQPNRQNAIRQNQPRQAS